jgi:hypothetical protein
MLTPMLATVVSIVLDVLWVVDHYLIHKKMLSVAVLYTNQCTLNVHVSIVSRLKNPSLTSPLLFIYTD